MKQKPVAWSYSVLSTFENCPKQYLEVNLKKSVKKENYAASDGARKHKEIELYLLNGTPSPTVDKYKPVIDHFKNSSGRLYVEHQMALGVDRKPVDFKEFFEAIQGLGMFWGITNQTPPLRGRPPGTPGA